MLPPDRVDSHLVILPRLGLAVLRHGYGFQLTSTDRGSQSLQGVYSWKEAQRQGGTLIIRAEPGRALELQYEASRIVARINSFFGYGAIAGIKVMQAQALMPKPAKAPPIPEKPVCEQELASLEESPLKAALERLGRGVAAASRSSPQGK